MDIQYLLLLQNLRNALGGTFNSFFAFITTIAVDYYVAIPALILFWAVDKKKGARVFATWGTALGINAALKTTFCVYRPWIRDSRVQPLEEVKAGATGYSFPSGHCSSSGGFYFGIISVYRKYKAICIFAVMMVLLTMFSRNYVGVHTPQDVLVGALIGIVAAVLVSMIVGWLEQHPEKDWMVLLIATIIIVILLCYIYFKPYPMDYVDGELLVDPKKMTVDGFKDPGTCYGILAGWFVEKHFVKFDISGSIANRIARCLFGALLFVFYLTVICAPIGKAISFGPAYFVLYASAPFLFMTVYPMIFKKIEDKHN